eukprot:6366801-Amphidinium_carterae.1
MPWEVFFYPSCRDVTSGRFNGSTQPVQAVATLGFESSEPDVSSILGDLGLAKSGQPKIVTLPFRGRGNP